MRRKRSTGLLLIVLLIVLTACSKSGVSIDSGDLKESTVALNQDGTVEMGIVEDFSKSYYNLDELKAFIESSISKFCKANGEKTVTLEYLKKKGDNIHATLAFDSVKSYAGYNQEDVKFMKLTEAVNAGIMPDFVEKSDKSGRVEVSTLGGDKYYVAVWKGDYQLLVEGKIVCYDNGIILNENTVQVSKEEYTFVIFN